MSQSTDIIDQWRAAVAGGSQEQLDQAEKVLRSPWVAVVQDLLAPRTDQRGRAQAAREWAEVLVLAVIWTDPPGVPPSELLVALPSQIGLDLADECYHSVSVYPPEESGDEGEEQPGELVQISLHRIPADRLRALAESTPASEDVVPFSGLLSGWLPDAAACFLNWDQGELSQGVAIHLGGAERAGECLLSLTCGAGPLDEVYASAIEMEPGEACLALVKNVHPSTAAPGTPVGSLLGGLGKGAPSRGQALRGLSPTPVARQSYTRRRGDGSAREGGSTPPPAGRGSAKARAKPAAKRKVMAAEETSSGWTSATDLAPGGRTSCSIGTSRGSAGRKGRAGASCRPSRRSRSVSARISTWSSQQHALFTCSGQNSTARNARDISSGICCWSWKPSLLRSTGRGPRTVGGAWRRQRVAPSESRASSSARKRKASGAIAKRRGRGRRRHQYGHTVSHPAAARAHGGEGRQGEDPSEDPRGHPLRSARLGGERSGRGEQLRWPDNERVADAPSSAAQSRAVSFSLGEPHRRESHPRAGVRPDRHALVNADVWAAAPSVPCEARTPAQDVDDALSPPHTQSHGQASRGRPGHHAVLEERRTSDDGEWLVGSLTGLPDPVEKSTAGLTHPQELSAAIQHVKEQRTLEDLLRKSGGNPGWPGQQNEPGAGGPKKPKGKGEQKGAVPPPTTS
eukprot:6482307-Amphidinium_carterae.2